MAEKPEKATDQERDQLLNSVCSKMAAAVRDPQTASGVNDVIRQHGDATMLRKLQEVLDKYQREAHEVVEDSECRGRVFIRLQRHEGLQSLAGIRVTLAGKDQAQQFFDCRTLPAHEDELRFGDLRDGNYTLQVYCPPDVKLLSEKVCIPGEVDKEVKGGGPIDFRVCAPKETIIHLDIGQTPCSVKIHVFDDRAGTCVPDGQPGIDGITVNILRGGKPLQCVKTTKDGSAVCQHLEPGVSYTALAPAEVRIKGSAEGGHKIYRLLHEGPILFVAQRDAPVVKIAYTGHKTSTVTIRPHVEGGALGGADQIDFALFSDKDRNLVLTGTSVAGESVTWSGVPADDPLTLVVKCSSSLELMSPHEGFFRVQVGAGSVNEFKEQVRVRQATETTEGTEISGQILDEHQNPVAYRMLEIVETAMQRLVHLTFTGETGDYSFQTRQNPARLSLRLAGPPSRIQGAQPQPVAIAAPAPPLPARRAGTQSRAELVGPEFVTRMR